jgi:hypothetical protein
MARRLRALVFAFTVAVSGCANDGPRQRIGLAGGTRIVRVLKDHETVVAVDRASDRVVWRTNVFREVDGLLPMIVGEPTIHGIHLDAEQCKIVLTIGKHAWVELDPATGRFLSFAQD